MGSLTTREIIRIINQNAAGNYGKLPPVAIEYGGEAWVWDKEHIMYLDCMSSYAVTNFGHRHPRLVRALKSQLKQLSVCSRALANEPFAIFCRDLAKFCDMGKVLPAVDGAGAIDKAIKVVRKWASKNNKENPRIISFDKNFHGRTYGALSLSNNPHYKEGFGPFLDGFITNLPFGDAANLERTLGRTTTINMWNNRHDDIAAIFIEPIQGEGGVIIPPDGYLKQVREFCTKYGILMVADEIQTGFGRTGYDLACQYEDVKPDIYLIGKALGGGLLPISAVVTTDEIMNVIGPGDDGSTFGGYPLGCAVAVEAIKVLKEEGLSKSARLLGEYFLEELKKTKSSAVVEVRGRGLMIGIEVQNELMAKKIQLELIERRLLCGVSNSVLRLNPPLIITKDEIDWALPRIEKVLMEAG
ncbi:MAG: ornithine--oxo-acid transaminase [Candidatus Yanofskybacteria bacterium RIFCSPHIGHO2_01_FULL_44_17]|uniref:ornithine aminotransferase n=1 Tax=Candidatus Yanofskybacteria bacterium RIFCSPHIGHO2_01_FULL_44_17 TaxID=1802668 RepID=A0A1F8EX01_9BACT|nr:MAG: ornithine--oxo-acid transaminase [Candidatus Yanofskybacteria bacterium RIFCSPHIGHO2_01_FULL_44_17]